MNLLVARYKIPFLISMMVSLGVIALSGSNLIDLSNKWNWLYAILVFIGSFIGIFILDLDFLLYTKFVDPDDEHTKPLAENRGIKKYLGYVNENEYSFDGLVFRSAIFEIILVIMAYYVVIVNSFIMVQAFMLSMLGNLIYSQIVEYQKTKSLKRWFWFSNDELNKNVYTLIFILLVVVYVYLFILL